MKKTEKLFVAAAGALALAMMFETSAFADSRHRNETWRGDRGDRRQSESRRSITMEGRIRSVDRDRDGYRVHLDRGDYAYWIPEASYRSWHQRSPGLRVGVSIRFGGYYDPRGYVYVSSADWLDDRYDRYDRYDDRRGYGREDLRGIVERVDYRRGTVVVRDEYSGRHVTVTMRRNSRGVDLGDLRRGDYVTFEGDWRRGGVFEADRIESLDSGRGRGRRW